MKNLIDCEFGRLIVRKYNGKINKKHFWLCDCICGTKNISIREDSLLRKDTESCGCIVIENNKKMFSKKNIYDLSHSFGIGFTSNTNNEFYFDLEDYDKIKNYCWRENDGYIVTTIDGKEVKMSRFIKNSIDVLIEVDHENRNRKDNRKNNLRNCSHFENSRNKSISVLNKSGVTGVSWSKEKQCWQISITINFKQKHLGYNKNIENAIFIRLKAEKELFGDFAPQRHLFEQYGI